MGYRIFGKCEECDKENVELWKYRVKNICEECLNHDYEPSYNPQKSSMIYRAQREAVGNVGNMKKKLSHKFNDPCSPFRRRNAE